jgi:serine protease Do
MVDGNSAFRAQVGNDTTASTPVRVVATDRCDDLAVVKLVNPVPNLRAVALGSAASVSPGGQVIALGFPGSAPSSLRGQQTATGPVLPTAP